MQPFDEIHMVGLCSDLIFVQAVHEETETVVGAYVLAMNKKVKRFTDIIS